MAAEPGRIETSVYNHEKQPRNKIKSEVRTLHDHHSNVWQGGKRHIQESLWFERQCTKGVGHLFTIFSLVFLWPWIGLTSWGNPAPWIPASYTEATTVFQTQRFYGHYSIPSWAIVSSFLIRDDKNKTLKSRPLRSVSKLKHPNFWESWEPTHHNSQPRQWCLLYSPHEEE